MCESCAVIAMNENENDLNIERRKRGRPSKPENEKACFGVGVELSKKDREKLDIIVKATGQTVANVIRRLINKEFYRLNALSIAEKERNGENVETFNEILKKSYNLELPDYDFTELDAWLARFVNRQ